MTRKRFWMFVTFAGVLLFVGGLILTISLAAETGHEVPDSECSDTMKADRADVLQATCVVSNDPKVLLGILPLMLGMGLAGVGVWRWIVAAAAEGGDSSDGSGGGTGVFGTLQQLQTSAEALQQHAADMQAQQTPGTPRAAGAAGWAGAQTMTVEQAQELQKEAMALAQKAGMITGGGTGPIVITAAGAVPTTPPATPPPTPPASPPETAPPASPPAPPTPPAPGEK